MSDISLDNFEKLSNISEDEHEVRDLVKVVFLGDSGVGKTNIMNRFSSNVFNLNSKPTIGVDFSVKTIKIDGQTVRLQLWDTAGQERYRTFTTAYFKDAHGVVIVYDVTSRESFDHIEEWFKICTSAVDLEKTGIIVLGNKIDLEDQRVVNKEEGKDFASKNGLLFMETSAFDNRDKCIDKGFYLLAKDLLPKVEFPKDDGPEIKKRKKSTIKLLDDRVDRDDEEDKKGKGCC